MDEKGYKVDVAELIPKEELKERVNKWTEGVKFDDNKPRFDLIAPEAEEALARILTFGADKYEGRNWEKGMKWGRVYGAMRRHLNAFILGEEIDKESGMPHLWHAYCCLHFLVTYSIRGVGENDLCQPSS
jgi:hypothetical protein